MMEEKRLIDDINYYIDKAEWGEDANKVLCWCKELIRKQPKVGEWIACKQELPDKAYCGYVWVSCSEEGGNYTQRARWEYGRFVWENRKPIKEQPVAWMPYFAPEPYREVEQE